MLLSFLVKRDNNVITSVNYVLLLLRNINYKNRKHVRFVKQFEYIYIINVYADTDFQLTFFVDIKNDRGYGS